MEKVKLEKDITGITGIPDYGMHLRSLDGIRVKFLKCDHYTVVM